MPDRAVRDVSAVHICTTQSNSGITAYARDFHRLVLEPEGYMLVDPEEAVLRGPMARSTSFHVQLGVFQHRERLAMSRLMRDGFTEIDATIHDPPFLTFPYFQFRSSTMMRLSRGLDWYLKSLGLQRRALERLRRVFVLSEHGRDALLRLAPRANAVVIPHIADLRDIWPSDAPLKPGLVYFGFIGPNKGLEYALELHRALRGIRPGTHLHVVGQASGEAGQRYLGQLKEKYRDGVTFHGYVPDAQLDELFAHAAHVILPYLPYKYIMPASGSVLHALRRARIVWTTNVNAMSEIIQDDKNGFMLSMDLQRDVDRLLSVIEDSILSRRISEGARQSALVMANYPYRAHFARTSEQ